MAIVDEIACAGGSRLGRPWPEAGGFPEVFWTAYDALFTQAGLRMGERVLVSGARRRGRDCGRAAGRRGRGDGHGDGAERGAARGVRALGASYVVEPGGEGEHGPYDVALELVGAPSLVQVLPHLATGARVVVIGVGAGAQIELNLYHLMADGPASAPRRCAPAAGARRRTWWPRSAPTCCRCFAGAGHRAGGRHLPHVRRGGGLRALREGRQARQGRAGQLSR